MEMADRIFAVDDITLFDLEEHLNELAVDKWVLHSIESVSTAEGTMPYFIVIAHRPHDWEAQIENYLRYNREGARWWVTEIL